jgi:hypothetical protein
VVSLACPAPAMDPPPGRGPQTSSRGAWITRSCLESILPCDVSDIIARLDRVKVCASILIGTFGVQIQFHRRVEMLLPDFLRPAVPASAGGPTGGSAAFSGGGWISVPGFAVPKQEQKNWCWAAVSHGVGAAYGVLPKAAAGKILSQCELAHNLLPLPIPPTDCCGKDGPGACDMYWSLDSPLRYLGCYNCRIDNLLQFPDIDAQIRQHQPIGCRIAWSGGGAHFVAIGACAVDPASGEGYVEVHDPSNGSPPIQTTVKTLQSAYGGAAGDQWTHSYLTALGGGGVVIASTSPPLRDPINA